MFRVCIGARHTCGFTNDSLGENSCNENRCSFPLMVRCGATFLYLELFNMERALLWGTSQSCGILGICLALAMCYYKLRTLTRHRPSSWCVFDPYFSSPKRKSFIITGFIKVFLRLGLLVISKTWNLLLTQWESQLLNYTFLEIYSRQKAGNVT